MLCCLLVLGCFWILKFWISENTFVFLVKGVWKEGCHRLWYVKRWSHWPSWCRAVVSADTVKALSNQCSVMKLCLLDITSKSLPQTTMSGNRTVDPWPCDVTPCHLSYFRYPRIYPKMYPLNFLEIEIWYNHEVSKRISWTTSENNHWKNKRDAAIPILVFMLWCVLVYSLPVSEEQVETGRGCQRNKKPSSSVCPRYR